MMQKAAERKDSSIVTLNRVSKSFGSEQVISDLSLDIHKEEFVSILGSSGCGKTTLLRIIAGLLRPDSGEVRRRCEKVAFVFQDDRLIPWKSVLANITAVSHEEIATNCLDRVGLQEALDKYPSQLSGGMKKRVGLARALAFGGDLLLMDEPFGSLDAVTKEKMIELVVELRNRSGFGALLVTHDPFEAAELSSRVIVVGKAFKKVKEYEFGHPEKRTLSDNMSCAQTLLEELRRISSQSE
jgi:NitT/TauT family transport system ATP-binding protein